jgi:hypothetical protein
VLTNQNPKATTLISELKSLPSGSAVVTTSGGNYGLGMNYAMAQGVDVFPVFYSGDKPTDTEYIRNYRYQSYIEWVNVKFNLAGINTLSQVQFLLSQGRDVYWLMPTVTPYWEGTFQTVGDGDIQKIVGVN